MQPRMNADRVFIKGKIRLFQRLSAFIRGFVLVLLAKIA
jgi:hypothetical protein